jgi:hypothetical protein
MDEFTIWRLAQALQNAWPHGIDAEIALRQYIREHGHPPYWRGWSRRGWFAYGWRPRRVAQG